LYSGQSKLLMPVCFESCINCSQAKGFDTVKY
jgi:hypothetical protein